MGEVIPHRVWRNSRTNKTASMYGAAPYGPNDAHEWELVTSGWTVKHPDGTVGIGRFAFQTKEEAEAWVEANPNFPGMSQG